MVHSQRALIVCVHLVSALMAEMGLAQGMMGHLGLLQCSSLDCGPLLYVAVITFSIPTTQPGTSLVGYMHMGRILVSLDIRYSRLCRASQSMPNQLDERCGWTATGVDSCVSAAVKWFHTHCPGGAHTSADRVYTWLSLGMLYVANPARMVVSSFPASHTWVRFWLQERQHVQLLASTRAPWHPGLSGSRVADNQLPPPCF